MSHIRMLNLALVATAISAITPAVQAGTIINQTYSGTFPATISGMLPNQAAALEEAFTLSAPGSVTLLTTSYATGGFEPNLMLYNSAGQYLATGVIPGTSPVAGRDSATGQAFDAYLTVPNLAAGTYTVALMDFLLGQTLTATNLSDGFNLNFGSGTTFVDEMGNSRTGNFTLQISTTSASAVPEPSTLLLAAPLLLGLAVGAKRRLAETRE